MRSAVLWAALLAQCAPPAAGFGYYAFTSGSEGDNADGDINTLVKEGGGDVDESTRSPSTCEDALVLGRDKAYHVDPGSYDGTTFITTGSWSLAFYVKPSEDDTDVSRVFVRVGVVTSNPYSAFAVGSVNGYLTFFDFVAGPVVTRVVIGEYRGFFAAFAKPYHVAVRYDAVAGVTTMYVNEIVVYEDEVAQWDFEWGMGEPGLYIGAMREGDATTRGGKWGIDELVFRPGVVDWPDLRATCLRDTPMPAVAVAPAVPAFPNKRIKVAEAASSIVDFRLTLFEKQQFGGSRRITLTFTSSTLGVIISPTTVELSSTDPVSVSVIGLYDGIEEPDEDFNVSITYDLNQDPYLSSVGPPMRPDVLLFTLVDTQSECDCTGVPRCGGDICFAAAQLCVDPTPGNATMGDFTCVCDPPMVGSRVAGVAVCRLDECIPDPDCSTCRDNYTCPAPLQECIDLDPDPLSLGDWQCTCTTPSVWIPSRLLNVTASNATCGAKDECIDVTACDADDQQCFDLDERSFDDWLCRCIAPAAGPDMALAAATCTLDECTASCASCENDICAEAGQQCQDPDATTPLTWTCKCVDPAIGAPGRQQPATCMLNECLEACATCSNDVCDDAQQICIDNNRTATSLGDWECRCIPPKHGSAPAAVAVCSFNECDAPGACDAATQDCDDPTPTSASPGDVRCTCRAPYSAAAAGSGCVLNECRATCSSCAGATCASPSACNDPDVAPDALFDWTCTCAPPFNAIAATAAMPRCQYDECSDSCATCANGACAQPMYVCMDADPGALGDWRCACAGAVAVALTAREPTCIVDECRGACATCAGKECAAPDYVCRDPNTGVLSVGDWVCGCVAPLTGLATGRAPTCLLDECTTVCPTCAGDTCAAQGQVCEDPAPATLSDWECVCADASARAVALPAQCATDPSVPAPATPVPTAATVKPTAQLATPTPLATSVPATPVPPTPQPTAPRPKTPIAPVQLAIIERNNKVGAGASLASSGAGAGTAGRLAIIRAINCDVEDIDIGFDTPLDFEFHPFGITFGDGPSRYLIAACLMNPLLIVCFVLLFCGVGSVVKLTDTSGMSWSRALGSVRTPGILYIPYVFVLQGTSLVSARLLFFPDKAGYWALLGGVLLGLCLVSPWVVYAMVLSKTRVCARAVDDPRLMTLEELAGLGLHDVTPYTGLRRTLYRFAFGRTIWVSKHDNQFCEKFGAMFESLKIDKSWVILTELSSILALSCLSVWKPSAMGECNARNFLLSAVCFGYLTVIVRHRPYYAQLDNVIALTLAVLVFVSVFFISMAIALEQTGEGSVWMVVAGFCMRVAPVVVVVKAVWDIMSYVGDIYLARRSSTRRRAREEDEGSWMRQESHGAMKSEMHEMTPLAAHGGSVRSVRKESGLELSQVVSDKCDVPLLVVRGEASWDEAPDVRGGAPRRCSTRRESEGSEEASPERIRLVDSPVGEVSAPSDVQRTQSVMQRPSFSRLGTGSSATLPNASQDAFGGESLPQGDAGPTASPRKVIAGRSVRRPGDTSAEPLTPPPPPSAKPRSPMRKRTLTWNPNKAAEASDGRSPDPLLDLVRGGGSQGSPLSAGRVGASPLLSTVLGTSTTGPGVLSRTLTTAGTRPPPPAASDASGDVTLRSPPLRLQTLRSPSANASACILGSVAAGALLRSSSRAPPALATPGDAVLAAAAVPSTHNLL